MTKNLYKKSQEITKIYQDIITIYEANNFQLSTKGVHIELETSYKYKKHIKTTENYLKALRDGAVPGVRLQFIKRKNHILSDHRNMDTMEHLKEMNEEALQHQKKIESKSILFAEEQIYMRLAMESIKDLDTLSEKHHKAIEKRLGLQHIKSQFFIDNDDMESVNMSDADILSLKDAIKRTSIVEFKYIGKSRKDKYVVEPYKLIIFDGLWYLFGKDTIDCETPYKTWRLIYIKDVDYDSNGKSTYKMNDTYTEAILKNAEDANFIVDTCGKQPILKKDITVKLKISSEIVDRFDHEAHIPGEVSEPIQNEDGSLTVTTKVNTLFDIDSEVKSLLPHIEVLERLELEGYLKG